MMFHTQSEICSVLGICLTSAWKFCYHKFSRQKEKPSIYRQKLMQFISSMLSKSYFRDLNREPLAPLFKVQFHPVPPIAFLESHFLWREVFLFPRLLLCLLISKCVAELITTRYTRFSFVAFIFTSAKYLPILN